MSIMEIARNNIESHLKNNAYPGRGLVVGRMKNSDRFALIYFIMGRSENSRNRRFRADKNRLWTEPVDEQKVSDPSLIIYDAMLSIPGVHIVSNGDQTTTIANGMSTGQTFFEAQAKREREPDAPNYTPRISGSIDLRGDIPQVSLSILKANIATPAHTDRYLFQPALPPAGIGYGITTYRKDGSPLPSYTGDPMIFPIQETPEQILKDYWSALDTDNRVSLAVKTITARGDLDTLLINNRHAD